MKEEHKQMDRFEIILQGVRIHKNYKAFYCYQIVQESPLI